MHSLFSGDLTSGTVESLDVFLYGCAVFLEPLHHAISRWNRVTGLLWVIVIWTIEYGSGLLLYKLLGAYPWYYQERLAVATV